MSTKRDLVEAHAFNRRRLVTAFTSGAPGGREVEPTRPGRALVGGAALSVLVLAGAAIAGLFSGRPPADWLAAPGVIISKETGQTYLVLDDDGDRPELRPSANLTSTRLLVGASLEPKTVAQSYISDQVVGRDIGILGAPQDLPTTDHLVTTWTACTAEGRGIRLGIDDRPEAVPSDTPEEAAPRGLVVSTGEGGQLRYHLVVATGDEAGAYALALPRALSQARAVAAELSLDLSRAVAVPTDWLELFPAGAPLTRSAVPVTAGSVVGYQVTAADGSTAPFRVGDLVLRSGQAYVLAQDGPQELSSFAADVYATGAGGQPLRPREVTQLGGRSPEVPVPAEWPAADPVQQEDACAVMDGRPGVAPRVRLGTPAPDDSGQGLPVPQRGRVDAEVQPGRGAVVTAAGFAVSSPAAGGTTYLVDSKGLRYELVGADVPDRLGYGTYERPVVPAAWTGLLRAGVALSVEAARLQPGQADPDGGGSGS